MEIGKLDKSSQSFRKDFDRRKRGLAPTEFDWYPYGTLNNFHILEKMLSAENRDFLANINDGLIADIGSADGDTAFFLESLGYRVHAIDYPPTNFNGCRGIRTLKQALNSNVEILEIDLDSQFSLPAREYSLVFFLGILYHLKNPYYALESLAKHARFALISTRVTRFNLPFDKKQGSGSVNQERVEIGSVPAAYLVAADETNNDATNFWMFTQAGLRRILDRCGWDILDFMTVGNLKNSDPTTNDGDERAFCYVRSRHF